MTQKVSPAPWRPRAVRAMERSSRLVAGVEWCGPERDDLVPGRVKVVCGHQHLKPAAARRCAEDWIRRSYR